MRGAYRRPREACGEIPQSYDYPEADRMWIIKRICQGSFKDHLLSTRGQLYIAGSPPVIVLES